MRVAFALPDVGSQRAHLNLVQSSRLLMELDPGAVVEAADGWLFGAGTCSHPVISNAAFRIDDSAEPEELLTRARAFFGERERGFSLWVKGGMPEDRDLLMSAEKSGFHCVYEMPEMLLDRRAEERPLPDGAELRRLGSAAQAEDYWRVAASSYASLGFPPEAFTSNSRHDGLLVENVAAFIAYLDGEPASIAMTIVTHGVAGVYWVGSLDTARGKGLGRAVTVAATNAGFDLGADVASLQASAMGRPIYEEMGYLTAYDYRLLVLPPP